MTTKLPISLLQGLAPRAFIARDVNGVTTETGIGLYAQFANKPNSELSYVNTTTVRLKTGIVSAPDYESYLEIPTAIDKTLAAFAPGTGNGGLDTGVVAANTWYYAHAIYNTSTEAPDLLLSLSKTAPTVPVGYTLLAYVGPVYTTSTSTVVPFKIKGNHFYFNPALKVFDISYSIGGGFYNNTFDMPIPNQGKIIADVGIMINDNNGSNVLHYLVPASVAPRAALRTCYTTRQGNRGSMNLNFDIAYDNERSTAIRFSNGGTGPVSIWLFGFTDQDMRVL